MIIKVQGILIGNSTLHHPHSIFAASENQTINHFVRVEHPSQLHIQAYFIYIDKSLYLFDNNALNN